MLLEHEVTPYLQLAILLAKSDGVVDGSETEFIDNARISFGLTENEVMDVEQTLKQGGCVSEITRMINNPNSQLYVIRELATLAFADGIYSESEKEFLTEVATAFQSNADFLEQCILWVQDGISWRLRGMKLLNQ
jgi:tellurite resistance protein